MHAQGARIRGEGGRLRYIDRALAFGLQDSWRSCLRTLRIPWVTRPRYIVCGCAGSSQLDARCWRYDVGQIPRKPEMSAKFGLALQSIMYRDETGDE